jgi:hypothetical protein
VLLDRSERIERKFQWHSLGYGSRVTRHWYFLSF